MAAQVTLVYAIVPQGPISLSALAAATTAVACPTDDLALIGATLISDNTAIGVGQVERTIVLGLDAAFNASYPTTESQKAVFRNLYRHILGRSLKSLVTASEPVLA